jgi:hypothetical protein
MAGSICQKPARSLSGISKLDFGNAPWRASDHPPPQPPAAPTPRVLLSQQSFAASATLMGCLRDA